MILALICNTVARLRVASVVLGDDAGSLLVLRFLPVAVPIGLFLGFRWVESYGSDVGEVQFSVCSRDLCRFENPWWIKAIAHHFFDLSKPRYAGWIGLEVNAQDFANPGQGCARVFIISYF